MPNQEIAVDAKFLSNQNFTLHQGSAGRLQCVVDGVTHEALPVRAFPISAAECGLSLVNSQGHELAWIADWQSLPAQWRGWLADALAQREFVPEITQIKAVSTFSTPSLWTVATDRGDSTLVLQGEEDIRRLGQGLRITASQGVQYSVRDIGALDRASRRLLERFL